MTKTVKQLVTHDGSFHADDIFACATLCLILEKENETFEIKRTRDLKIIKNGDYVFDVGGVYNKETNRFDHHQVGGAGRRSSGEGQVVVEYASFGLVWEKFGKIISGDERVVEIIDKRLAMPIDAFDNGLDLVENKYEVTPYYIQHLFFSMRPTWKEESLSKDTMFLKCVEIAKSVLAREIIQAQDALLAEELVISIYKNTSDKRIIVLDKHYPYEYVLNNFPEPLFAVYLKESDNSWQIKAIKENPKTFVNRKNFPKAWAGLRDEELENITGVKGAVFCHRGLFLAVAQTKEGAIKLAQIAVES
ncbi:MAG: MYG1 family protein [Candidatus Pacebacteria bacterium]|nr:MYG1 family protein [Candidatus Paceibacterota bacterium]